MPLYDVTNICTNISTNTAKRHPAWVKGSRDVIFRRLLQTKRGVSNFQQERGSSPRPFHGGGVEFPDLATVHGAGVVSEAAAAERRLFFSSDSAFK